MHPGHLVGRFRLDSPLGRGGFGDVWKAWDSSLSRFVALKLLHSGDPADLPRFAREATLAASLSHPNIARIYEAGDLDGRPYIAMQFIDGIPLSKWSGDDREAARLIRDAARAVHHAHEQGILHRDLKPANIMVERPSPGLREVEGKRPSPGLPSGLQSPGLPSPGLRASGVERPSPGLPSGLPSPGLRASGVERPSPGLPSDLRVFGSDLRAFVMDFGLAKRLAVDSSLSASGLAIGTPSYMSPEQARGDIHSTDPRSDIYGLGATLYHLLAGRPPFDGPDSFSILLQVIEDDPPPIPRGDPELHTIVFKCLDKNPARRYASAADLADDLDRFLHAEPVSARRPGLVRRHRRLAIVLALTLVAGAAAAAALLGLRHGDRRLAGARQDLVDQMRTTTTTCLDAALELRRVGDLDGMRRRLADVETACRKVIDAHPSLAEPHVRWGRMLRALMDFDRALQQQELALAKDPDHEEARFERGLLLVRLYEERIVELKIQWRRDEPEFMLRGAETGARRKPPSRLKLEDDQARALREKADADLSRSTAPLAHAIREFLAGRQKSAQPLFADAARDPAAPVEVWEWIGRTAAFAERYADAVDAFTRGLERDRGYVPFLLGRSSAHYNEGIRLEDTGGDWRASFEASARDAEAAAALDPSPDGWLRLGDSCTALGDFERAFRAYAAALAAAPDRPDILAARAHASINRAGAADPVPHYEAAIADLDRALKADERLEAAWRSRGRARFRWGSHLARLGGDAAPHFEAALRDLDRALSLNAGRPETFELRACLLMGWGAWSQSRGRSADARFEAALRDCAESDRLAPGRAEPFQLRANIRIQQAAFARDPVPLYRAAIQDLDTALDRNPKYAAVYRIRAQARGNLAVRIREQGGDPAPLYEAAIRDCDESLRLEPTESAFAVRARWKNNLAAVLERRGRDIAELLAGALKDATEATRLNPRSGEAWIAAATAHLAIGRRGRGDGPYEEAIRCANEAVRLDPTDADALLCRARARADWARAPGTPEPAALLDDAIRDHAEVVRVNPKDGVGWTEYGAMLVNRGLVKMKARQDPLADYAAAIEAFQRAIELRPRHAQNHLFRGNAHSNRALYLVAKKRDAEADCRAALEAYAEAVRLDPSMEERTKSQREWCRAKLEK